MHPISSNFAPQIAIALTILVAVVCAKPSVFAAPYTVAAPLVSAPFVAATSSQVFARNYNGLLTAAVPATISAVYPPQIVGSDAETFSSYVAYPHHVQQPYAAYPYPGIVGGAPLKYVAAPGPFVL